MRYGLVRDDDDLLERVINAMDVNGDDSDGDGVGDIAELRAETDPNVNDLTGQVPGDPIRYGFYCATVPGGHGSFGAPAWAAGFFLALFIARRRRGPLSRARV